MSYVEPENVAHRRSDLADLGDVATLSLLAMTLKRSAARINDMTALASMVSIAGGQQPGSWLGAMAQLVVIEPRSLMTAVVPIALALFALRVTRGRLPRTRVLYGVTAAVPWSGFQAAQLLRAFGGIHASSSVMWSIFFAAVFPVLGASGAGFAIGAWRRLTLRFALPLTVVSAMIATAIGIVAAFNFVDLVNASG